MTEAEFTEAITAAFVDGWELLHPDNPADPDYCPIAAEGESFPAAATWVRFSIVPVDREQMSMGPPGARRMGDTGFVAVQVFSEIDQGTTARARLCDDVRASLEMQTFAVAGYSEQIRVFEGASKSPSTDGRWLSQTVVLRWQVIGTA